MIRLENNMVILDNQGWYSDVTDIFSLRFPYTASRFIKHKLPKPGYIV